MATVWVLTDTRYLGQRMPAAFIDQLSTRGVRARVLVADQLVAEAGCAPGIRDPWAALRDGDVVVARTRNRFGLSLLSAAERRGVGVLTPWAPIAAVRDKPRAAQMLAVHGLPTPRTFLASSPGSLKALPPECFPLILKPHAGDNGHGLVLVSEPSALDDVHWEDSMALAQEFVECGGVDLKLYVAGERLWAVRRPSPLGRTTGQPGLDGAAAEAVEPTPELRRLALACGEAFGLTLFGIDLLESPRGPLIVDVNEFPNYTGVPEAPEAIATLVVGHLRARQAA